MVDIIKFRPPERKPANRLMVNGVFAVRKTADDAAVVLTVASTRLEMNPALALELADALIWWANAVEDGQGDLLDDYEDEPA